MKFRFFSRLREDIRRFDRHNTEEAPVIAAHYFSCYRGVPVIRYGGARSGSFGIIFLRRLVNDWEPPLAADELRHEYGHIVQLRRLGLLRFALCIGVASWRCWGTGAYYSKPWEITADLFGGVILRKHEQPELEAGMRYLERSKKVGPLVWRDIK